MQKTIKKIALLVILSLAVLPAVFALAQESASDPLAERQLLEEELKKLEEELVKMDQNISKTEKEKNTLKKQISSLRQKVDKLNLQIRQSNIMIKDLQFQISDTQDSILQTALKIDDSKEKLASSLRAIYEQDQKSLLEIFISEQKISNFFSNLISLEILSSKSKDLLKNIKELKYYLESQKDSLDSEKADLENVVKIKLLQKQENEKNKRDQENFLKLTEEQYQKQLLEKKAAQARAAQIRVRIFELIGIPEAPTFGQAYDLAKEVERITNVRPAFLLAILTQESNIGKNVGQCYVKDFSTGDGVSIRNNLPVSKIMKPSRDIAKFLEITQSLGRDPGNTPVSCPIASVGGYGGAMGPAQFIPSTWMAYRDRVRQATGKIDDPWAIKDSFLAAGFYLEDYGAAKRTTEAERKAALIYFSGSTKSKYRFYADSVLAIAKQYEQDIKDLES